MRYDDDRLALARWEGEGGLVPTEIGGVRSRPDRRGPRDREVPTPRGLTTSLSDPPRRDDDDRRESNSTDPGRLGPGHLR